jgi:lysophospholipase L1-like esterase
MNISRRNFLGKTAVGVAATASIASIVSACVPEKETKTEQKQSFLKQGDVVLFQGDSITDAGRKRENERPNMPDAFGYGYPFVAAAKLLNDYSDDQLLIYNRGISGNKVYQLAERWDKDCLELKPDVLSILIGVNDYWHKRNGHYDGTIEIYENDYRKLIERTLKALPDVKLILCEPYYVLDVKWVDESWVEPMKQYQAVAKKMADEFGTLWVPYQKIYDEAIKHAPGSYWTLDGVHPAMPGFQLMAEAWLRVAGV